MAELQNLAGVATKDLVENIGSGKFSAAYINWSRTLNLLRTHAPGWMPECVPNADGDILHRAPVGGYLQIRFVHLDGTATPAYQQAVMDNRHKSIPYEKISSRDITDTQRRGWCLAAAAVFGIGVEMWTRDPLESGYQDDGDSAEAPKAAPKAETATEATFREAALGKGFTTYAIEGLLGVIKGDFASGVATVAKKTSNEVAMLNAKFAPEKPADEDEQW